MYAKRIIPCLDVKNRRVVKGVSFVDLRDAGDPVECAAAYDRQGADELVLLDITATHEGRSTMLDIVERVAKTVFIPFTVGGGIKTVDDFKVLLRAGADKISVNSAAVRNPDLINEASYKFGAQCVVCAIDAKSSVGMSMSTSPVMSMNHESTSHINAFTSFFLRHIYPFKARPPNRCINPNNSE